MSTATFLAPAASLERPTRAFFDGVKEALAGGARPLAFFGQPAAAVEDLTLTMVLEEAGQVRALRCAVDRAHGFHSLTRAHPVPLRLRVLKRPVSTSDCSAAR